MPEQPPVTRPATAGVNSPADIDALGDAHGNGYRNGYKDGLADYARLQQLDGGYIEDDDAKLSAFIGLCVFAAMLALLWLAMSKPYTPEVSR